MFTFKKAKERQQSTGNPNVQSANESDFYFRQHLYTFTPVCPENMHSCAHTNIYSQTMAFVELSLPKVILVFLLLYGMIQPQ